MTLKQSATLSKDEINNLFSQLVEEHQGQSSKVVTKEEQAVRANDRHTVDAASQYSVETIVTDRLRSYPAAMRELGNEDRREVGRHLNNRAENSHLPFRGRERAMLRFRQMKSLQKFASVHASTSNHFQAQRQLGDRQTFKELRSAALARWQNLAAGNQELSGWLRLAETSSHRTDTSVFARPAVAASARARAISSISTEPSRPRRV